MSSNLNEPFKDWVIGILVNKATEIEEKIQKLSIFDPDSIFFDAGYEKAWAFKENIQNVSWNWGNNFPGAKISIDVIYLPSQYPSGHPRINFPDFRLRFSFYRDSTLPPRSINELPFFINTFGDRCLQAFHIVYQLLDKVLEDAKKIRRNILYPEVVEFERQIDSLIARESFLKDRVKELEAAIEEAVVGVWNTRGIFEKLHSKTLRNIREKLLSKLPHEKRLTLLTVMALPALSDPGCSFIE